MESFYNLRPKKKPRTSQLTTKVPVAIHVCDGVTKPIRCLLNTGTSATNILKRYVAKGKTNIF